MTNFSTGLWWHLLHVLDHTHYLTPRTDYIPLPPEALTPSTRLRWWQAPAHDNTKRTQWAIDNVLVGGTVINPSSFHQSFDLDTPQQVSDLEYYTVCCRNPSKLLQ